MSIYKIVFSPTGGTQKAADLLANAWGGDVKQIDISSPDFAAADLDLRKDDIAIIAMPSFGGRLPAVAAERLASCAGNGSSAVLLCVYGNRAYDDTLIELYDIATKCGFSIAAAVAAVAEHSIVRKYAANRPDAVDEATLKDYGRRIADKIAAGGAGLAEVPGHRPYKKPMGKKLIPKAASNCTGCGLCAAKCPVAAIDKDNPHQVNESACLSCMRCVSLCPQKARSLNSLMVGTISLMLKMVCSQRKDCEIYL